MTKEEIINKVLEDWAAEFLKEIEASAKSQLPADTGEGGDSFDTSVIRARLKDGATTTATVMASFNSYMRYFDMGNRSMRRGKDFDDAGMERLKDWVSRHLSELKGGYKQPLVYKYKPGTIPDSRIINNIAWGISKTKRRIKRKRWYVKLKATKQYALYYQLLDELMPVMLEEAKKKLDL